MRWNTIKFWHAIRNFGKFTEIQDTMENFPLLVFSLILCYLFKLSDEEKAAVPEHIQKAAREMGRKAFEQKLKEIGMSGYDASVYSQFSEAVKPQVQSLRIILESLQTKNKERYWSRHQTSGELDDVKLIDGL